MKVHENLLSLVEVGAAVARVSISCSHGRTDRAFLKQPKVFLSSKKSGKWKQPRKGGNRFSKNVGLGFKTPK